MALLLSHAQQNPKSLTYLLVRISGSISVGCEVVPKTLAVRASEAWALRVVRPMGWLLLLTRWPRDLAKSLTEALLRRIVPRHWRPQTGLTDGEYEELFELAFQQGALARSEKEIILQIIQLDRRTAG